MTMEDYYAYTPTTDDTTDRAAAIAKDFQTMEAQLALGSDGDGRTRARSIYELGAYCQSYAKLDLAAPLATDVPIGAKVAGSATTQSQGTGSIAGVTRKAAQAGDTVLEVQYRLKQGVPASQGVTQLCSVGGNPTPQLDQCLASTGQVSVQLPGSSRTDTYGYSSYTASTDTFNGLSLQKLATTAISSNPTYRAFVNYYGSSDYANKWIEHAFDQEKTSFDHGNNDFAIFQVDEGGVDKAITVGSLAMSTWMHVIRTMGDAVQECRSHGQEQVSAAVSLWDDAVSFYRGIGGAVDGSLDQLYHFAETYCKLFGTCSSESSMAFVNQELFQEWNQGKAHLLQGHCDAAEALVGEITSLMTVPLVQGLLFHTYELDIYQDQREVVQAEAATFAAALLPLLHECSAGHANLVHRNVMVGKGTTASFEVVKGALERQYDCLGISCQDIGGLVSLANREEYLYNAEPCAFSPVSNPSAASENDGINAVAIGLGVGLPLLALIIVLTAYQFRSRKKQEKEIDTAVTGVVPLEETGAEKAENPNMKIT